MENEEMLEQTNDTENVETQTTEENGEGIELTDTTESTNEVEEEKEEVRRFTQEEVDEIVRRRLARKERDFQKELSKYKSTEEVLKVGLNATDINDAEDKLREYWGNEGTKLPDKVQPGLSNDELIMLGNGDAENFIKDGYQVMAEEANRLASKGYQNLNLREKTTFDKLVDTLHREKDKKELLKLGAKEELLSDKSFIDFRNKFNSTTPINEIYDMYMKNNSNKTVKENPGSMKNNEVSTIKDFYTPEEISQLSDEQLDDPKIWEAVRKSMTKNGKINYYE
jgi:hypothetical protein